MKFIHLTDPHFVPKGDTLYGRDPSVTLAAAIADINHHHHDADAVVITGDLTHLGQEAAFAHLAETLAPLAPPLKLLIGNHDHRPSFAQFFPDQVFDKNGFAQSTLQTPAGVFIFLDTVLEGTHAGHYCAARCAWLAETLDAVGDQDAYVFMHHPPFNVGVAAMDAIGLHQKQAFQDVILPRQHKIRHLFFGHLHRPVAGSWLDIPFSTLRGTNHQVWYDIDNPVLQGSFEPPAYCVVNINAETVIVHYHDFLDDSQKFSFDDSPWDDWSRAEKHP
jgi:3',5'-cyclic AMP phosphodiesterase CpdA